MNTVREAAVAGLFYPSDPEELAFEVDELLASAPAPGLRAHVIMAPHAGHIYSGETAAVAYKTLDPKCRRVVIFGPTHRVGIGGMALTGADALDTPLGRIEVDPDLTFDLQQLPSVVTSPRVHEEEHSIEAHLPFLQRYLEDPFSVVPVAVGQSHPDEVAAAIRLALQDGDTSVIISSDLSHYLPYEDALREDDATLAQIVAGAPALTSDQACGVYPVSGMMAYAQAEGLTPVVLYANNSGDTAGDKERVVGYAAVAWLPSASDDQTLPRIAASAIEQTLFPSLEAVRPSVDGAWAGLLEEPAATFVTLTKNGKLRGCVGTLVPYRSLEEDIIANAGAAAFDDGRFPPVTAEEFAEVDIEVARLTELARLPQGLSEDEVISRLRPGVDGVMITWQDCRATYLPRVWSQLPDAATFFTNLKVKAGLAEDFWADDVVIETYQVQTWNLDRGPHGERDA